MSKIIGAAVATPISPQASMNKTTQAEQIAQNTQDINALKTSASDIQFAKGESVVTATFTLDDGRVKTGEIHIDENDTPTKFVMDGVVCTFGFTGFGAEKVCQDCGGTGVVACPDCGGTGEVCGMCYGHWNEEAGKCDDCGEMMGTSSCDTCKGTGVAICPTCGGENLSDCPSCGGKGHDELLMECNTCRGTGKIINTNVG